MGSCTSSMRDFMNGHDSSQPHVSLLVDAAKRDDYTQLHGILVLRERFPEYVNIDQADDVRYYGIFNIYIFCILCCI